MIPTTGLFSSRVSPEKRNDEYLNQGLDFEPGKPFSFALKIREACSRRIFLRIFPVEVLGSSWKMMVLGTLKPARCSRQKRINSPSLIELPGLRVTKAHGVSPHCSSGLATTAASKH